MACGQLKPFTVDCTIDEDYSDLNFASALLSLKHSSPKDVKQVFGESSTFEGMKPDFGTRTYDEDDSASGVKRGIHEIISPVSSSDSNDSGHMSTNAKKVARGHYRCGRCGQPKTSHICMVTADYVATFPATTQTVFPPYDLFHEKTITVRTNHSFK